MIHKSKIGDCRCGAELCVQSNGADYEGPAYWVGGEYGCNHAVDGTEDHLYSEEVKVQHIERQLKNIHPSFQKIIDDFQANFKGV